MEYQPLKAAKIKIDGMTCGSCEIMLERKLMKVPGIVKAEVDYRSGMACVYANPNHLPEEEAVRFVIKDAGYHLRDDHTPHPREENGVLKVRIDGMNDVNCERLIREKLKLVDGVDHASVHANRGTANIYYTKKTPSFDELKKTIESMGFRFRHFDEKPIPLEEPPRQKWLEIGACLILIFALYKFLQAFDIVSLVSGSAGEAATYGGILLIGLVAGTSSCLAVTGGLLLSVAAKYNETHQSLSKWQKFKPLLSFNIGRLISYFFFGGLVGILGQSITLSPRMTGYMNIVIALIMLYLALSILKILPKGNFGIHPPKRVSHWIAGLSESEHPLAPAGLGALTFFLPCGFTQSLQLVALASGSFFTGSMTMFIFALGTLPALLGISAISSTVKGSLSRLFLRFSGALVLVLSIFNLNNGLLLTGVDAASLLSTSNQNITVNDPNVVQEADGSQTILMRVTAYGYSPREFTVQGGKPTFVKAMADSDIGGCASVLTAPTFGLTKWLRPGENILGPFTPKQDFLLMCSMGMIRANVRVISDKLEAAGTPDLSKNVFASLPSDAQIVDLVWTNTGYSPPVLEVTGGSPTVVRISATSRVGGCMSTIVFPEFNQSAFVPGPGEAPLPLALETENALPGDYPITCGMGAKMATLRVQ